MSTETKEEVKDGECFLCHEQTCCVAGNPSRWPMRLEFHGGNGQTRFYHRGCVVDAISQLAQLTRERDVIKAKAQAVVDVWEHNSGRVFESMGSNNPRAMLIDRAAIELRAALATTVQSNNQ